MPSSVPPEGLPREERECGVSLRMSLHLEADFFRVGCDDDELEVWKRSHLSLFPEVC